MTRCGAPIDQRMELSKTALMFAVASSCVPAVRAVLALGANVNMRDEQGWTALMVCCQVRPPPPPQHGLSSKKMTLITSYCGATRSLSSKWP